MMNTVDLIKPHQGDSMSFRLVTPELARRYVATEEAAKFMCGGQLGECYIIEEIIDNYMVDAVCYFGEKDNRKWFNHTIKKNIKEAHRKLRECIVMSRSSSVSNSELMMAVSDEFYGEMKADLDRIFYGMSNELSRRVEDARTLSCLLLMDFLFRFVAVRYDVIIGEMCKIYGGYDFYDSWYCNASGRVPYHYFKLALDEYDARFVKVDVDTNKIKSLTDGVKVIANKLRTLLNSDLHDRIAAEYGGDKGDDIYEASLKVLGIAM